MNNQINIQKNNVLKAYQIAKETGADSTMKVLEQLFGEETFKPMDVKERIATFGDALLELGEEHPLIISYRQWANNMEDNDPNLRAFLELRIICTALNEGWQPQFTEDEWRYYPWFYIYTKEEYDNLDEEEKAKCRVVGRSSSNAYAYGGPVYAVASSASSHSSTYFGGRLAFKSRELAEYCGEQFIDIWEKYLFE